jgi:hypothetical protein
MPPKRLLCRSEPWAKPLRGATTLADAIRVTLGPRSKSVLIAKKWGPPARAPYPRAPRRPSRAGVLPGVDRETFRDLAVPAGYHVRVEREAPSPFVELDRVRRAGDYLLATASAPLAWLRVQRTRLRFAIEDRLRAWKHAHAGALA